MLLAILLAGSAVAVPSAQLGPICRNPETLRADEAVPKAGIRPLGDEPPARHIRAVLRTDFDGCVKPVTIDARVGKR